MENNVNKNETIIYNREKEKISNKNPLPPYLFIKEFISKKTLRPYLGTIINGTFYFVHIDDGVKLEKRYERKTNNVYYLYNGKYDIINTEKSKDIYIYELTMEEEIEEKNKLLKEIKIDE